MATQFVSKLTFSPDDIAAADQLEPVLESLLRSLKVHDSVIMAMRVNEILDRALFTDLAQDSKNATKRLASIRLKTKSSHSNVRWPNSSVPGVSPKRSLT